MISSKPLKEHLSITIDSDIIVKLRKQSQLCDRSLSQYINIILKKYVNEEKCEYLKNKIESP